MKITVDEIKAIPAGGSITRKFSAGKEAYSAANTVQYVKRTHKRPDGKTYKCSTNWELQEFTVRVVDP